MRHPLIPTMLLAALIAGCGSHPSPETRIPMTAQDHTTLRSFTPDSVRITKLARLIQQAYDHDHDNVIRLVTPAGAADETLHRDSGQITYLSLFQAADTNFDQQVTSAELQRALAAEDLNQNGRLDGEELHLRYGGGGIFQVLRRSPAKQPAVASFDIPAFVRAAFFHYDHNRNGVIERQPPVVSVRGTDENFIAFGASASLQSLFTEADVNGDNQVTMAELRKTIRNHDFNGDGELSNNATAPEQDIFRAKFTSGGVF